MVGGFGVSGDGVDQDDFDTFGAAQQFVPDVSKRADSIDLPAPGGPVRLPYFKFPRNPTLLGTQGAAGQ